jgi:2-C-methyl-D-erythritol 2,4-cyclodiphosphate synthase
MFRIGHGYDAHRLVEGRSLILGGVLVPFDKGLEGHSDADVAVHALIDALLGAAALGDIGMHFPDSDARYKGANSLDLLREVVKMLEGYIICNVDITIIAQSPKLAPYIPLMREDLTWILGIDPAQVSVKATTEEHMGFTGSGEGISAHAVVLLEWGNV